VTGEVTFLSSSFFENNDARIRALAARFTGYTVAIDHISIRNWLKQFDEEDIAGTYNGQSLTKRTAPTSLAQAAGYQMVAFDFPVLESNPIYYVYFDFPVDATFRYLGSSANITGYLYDSAQYLDRNTNTIECGVNNENGIDIGAVAADSFTVYGSDA